jgi:hypothetical protein
MGQRKKWGWRFMLAMQKTESLEDGFPFLTIAFGEPLARETK